MAVKNVIVFIHGIGKHDSGWSSTGDASPVEQLKKASQHYTDVFPPDNPLENSVVFEEVRYDDTFETVRGQWHDLANNLLQAGFDGATATSVQALKDRMPGIIQEIADATDPEKFIATHAMDAFAYKFLPLIKNIVRYSVAAQLAGIAAKHLKPNIDDDPTYTIVAHSLGTAVAYDAIDLLGRTNWLKGVNTITDENLAQQIDQDGFDRAKQRYGNNPFSSKGIWAWRGLMMISNVSTLFCRHPRPRSVEARVRPKTSGGSNGQSVEFYINVDHLFDPVAKLDAFSAERTWPTAKQNGFALDKVDVKHFYDKNIHGFGHYIMHPGVHSRVFWLACPQRFRFSSVRKADDRVGGGDFSNFGGQLADDAFRKVVEDGLAKVANTNPDKATIDNYVKRLKKLTGVIL